MRFSSTVRISTVSSVLGATLLMTVAAVAQTSFTPTTVIFVRHAEKQDVPGPDPALSPVGQERAKNLSRILASTGIKAVYTSQYIRTKETGRPTAEAAGISLSEVRLEPDPHDRRKLAQSSINGLLDGVYQYEGHTVLVVGHTNTIGLLIGALGGGSVDEISESDYGNLFVVTIFAKGKANVTRLKY